LSAVDASVGGKTAVDHPAGKNLIGAFHQPSGVVIDVTTLRTLPDAELESGLAECVKHAVIRDASLLDFLEARRKDILARDGDCLTELIARNVAIKAAVVSADERERGERADLNFGHTVGHAVETLLGYGAISHGAAVSLGMAAACRLAVDRGLLPAADAARVESLLLALGLPVRWRGLDPAAIWDLMLRDKKAQAGQVRMILPVRLGEVKIFADVAPEAVARAVKDLGQ
jgi:3-dehydroquinate synthase